MVQEPSAASLSMQTDVSSSAQANASPATGTAHQDIVTLAGRADEGQQARAGTDGGQFGESAAFFLAEKQSFRAGSGSGGSQIPQTPSVPQLPVKIVQERSLGQNTQAAEHEANAANAANASAETAQSDSPATQQPRSSSGAAGADTPLAELTQLDDTLQQMGVNPQSISLFNRMAMVLYANDPAALRVLVQTLQSGAEQFGGSSNDDTANGATPPSSSPSSQSQATTTSGSQTESPLGGHFTIVRRFRNRPDFRLGTLYREPIRYRYDR